MAIRQFGTGTLGGQQIQPIGTTQQPLPTTAPRGFEDGPAEQPQQAEQIDPNWKPDPKNPFAKPPGIPDSIWQDYLGGDLGPNSPKGAQQAWQKDPAGMVAGLYKNYVLPGWQKLTPAQRDAYTQHDATGNPFTIGTPEAAEWDRNQDVKNTRDTNVSTFEDWEKQFLPGVKDAMDAAGTGDKRALDKLQSMLGSIQDPEIAKYVGDYVSQAANAAPDQRDVEAQQRQLSKLESLEDPSITPEEKLMMEMSRQKTESDLRAQRGAIANSLQARGVYGSGAELTQNAMAQQEAAQRQALEMLGAESNASQRAMTALKDAGDLSTSMRGSSAQESQFRGTAADSAAQFNNTLKDSYNQWKAKQQADNNAAKTDRAKTGFDAVTGYNSNRVKDIVAGADLGLRGAQGKTGQLAGDTAPVSSSYHDSALLDDKDKTAHQIEGL